MESFDVAYRIADSSGALAPKDLLIGSKAAVYLKQVASRQFLGGTCFHREKINIAPLH